MNDSQFTRYAAIEARLPEGFPRRKDHNISRGFGGDVVGRLPHTRPISDLERLGFGVLVLRACWEAEKPTSKRSLLSEWCEAGLHREDLADKAIGITLTVLESTYPEGAKP